MLLAVLFICLLLALRFKLILVLIANICRLSLNYDTFLSFFFLKALISFYGYSYFHSSLSFLETVMFPFSQICCQSWGSPLIYNTQTLSDAFGIETFAFSFFFDENYDWSSHSLLSGLLPGLLMSKLDALSLMLCSVPKDDVNFKLGDLS